MANKKTIEVCKGYGCSGLGSEVLRGRLEMIAAGLDYTMQSRNCSGHCSKGPIVIIDGDMYSGRADIFLESERKIRDFLYGYQSATKIDGICGSATGSDCGLALDIGTTAIKASLTELHSGRVIGEVSTINKQQAFGATVLHRWNYVTKAPLGEKERNLSELSCIVRRSADDISRFFEDKSHGKIVKTVISGNTAMTYFYLDENPCLTLSDKPDYGAVRRDGMRVCLPCVFEWVGGDIVAGMTYLGFDRHEMNAMLIDLGTNGEIALSTKDGILLVAAASAGPAFEGEGFRCGMTATKGAIYEVCHKDFQYKVMGQRKPLGLCGSGMLDLIAAMLVNKVIDFSGRLDESYGSEFFLTGDISVRQAEIDYFKQSKAAIYATIQTLLRQAEITVRDLDAIYIAGGFGNLCVDKAQLIGLLPPSSRYEFMGNTSLRGAELCLSDEAVARAEGIARSAIPLDLVKSPDWMDNYRASLFFPHTDVDAFSAVLGRYMK